MNAEIQKKKTVKRFQYALNFTKNFDDSDHKLTFDFQYEDSNEDENSLITVDGIESEMVSTLEDQTNILLRSDYVVPVGEMSQIETWFPW